MTRGDDELLGRRRYVRIHVRGYPWKRFAPRIKTDRRKSPIVHLDAYTGPARFRGSMLWLRGINRRSPRDFIRDTLLCKAEDCRSLAMIPGLILPRIPPAPMHSPLGKEIIPIFPAFPLRLGVYSDSRRPSLSTDSTVVLVERGLWGKGGIAWSNFCIKIRIYFSTRLEGKIYTKNCSLVLIRASINYTRMSLLL